MQNYLNFINTTDPDNSGNLAFLINELQDAEDNGERVWILGHVSFAPPLVWSIY